MSLSAGYEDGIYRTNDLTRFMVDAIPEFALTHDEFEQIKHHNAAQKLREAAASLYDKAESERGEPGEIILHLLLRDYVGTFPVASKVYFTDSNNSNVKGFDIVHAKENSGKFLIYVGESKLTKSFESAVTSLQDDILKHMNTDFLKKEFMFIGRKISKQWVHHDSFLAQIDGKRSIDQIKDDLVFVAFAAYECEVTKKHNENNDAYAQALEVDLQQKLERMVKSFGNLEVSLHVILLPVVSKEELRKSFDKRLKALKEI